MGNIYVLKLLFSILKIPLSSFSFLSLEYPNDSQQQEKNRNFKNWQKT
jgi:hypothetical protein